MNEISSLRNEVGKIFEIDPALGLGKYQLEARTGPIHYKYAYLDTDPWLDLDETYREDGGDHWLYPKMPNIVKVFKNICGYEIQNRSNPAHTMRVELQQINGLDVTNWVSDKDISAFAKVHPFRVGIWKQFKRARAIPWRLRWKVTEVGRSEKAKWLLNFRENPEAWSTVDLTHPNLEDLKVAVTGTRTRLDDTSWMWEELIPRTAMLVDTDWEEQTAASADDGYRRAGPDGFSATGNLRLGDSTGTVYNAFMRFASVEIANATDLITASMTVCADTTNASTPVNATIYCEDADNASQITTYGDYDSRSVTAGASWANITGFTAGNWYTSPSIITPVQAVVDRASFSSGNAIQILFKNATGSTTTRYSKSYDTGSSYAPKLTLSWADPAGYSGRGIGRGICRGIMR